ATQDLLRLFPSYLTKGSKGNERERSNTSEDSCVLPKCTHPLFSWRLSNLLCLRIIRRHHLREVIVKMPFDLPDDILVEVFTYLTVEDIVLRIRHVNERWVAVAENSRVWKRLTYRPTLRYSEKEIIDFLRQAPKLQWFVPPCGYTTTALLMAIMKYCKNIRNLELNMAEANCNLLEKLVSDCPNIETLTVIDDNFGGSRCLRFVSQFPKVKTLRLNDDFYLTSGTGRRHEYILAELALGCPSLQCLDLRSLKRYSSLDLEFLLERKKQDIVTLFLNCSCREDYFDTGPVQSLEKIDLSGYKHFETKLTWTIFEKCHNLKQLNFKECPDINDESLEKICNLRQLECLNVACCNDLTDRGVAHIVECSNLNGRILINSFLFGMMSGNNLIGRLLQLESCDTSRSRSQHDGQKRQLDWLRHACLGLPRTKPQPSQALVRQLAPPVLFWVLYKVIRKYKYGGDEVLIVIL
ncbi:F-box/LRR-repeat protein 2, partial [Gryllus bimaculatus]